MSGQHPSHPSTRIGERMGKAYGTGLFADGPRLTLCGFSLSSHYAGPSVGPDVLAALMASDDVPSLSDLFPARPAWMADGLCLEYRA